MPLHTLACLSLPLRGCLLLPVSVERKAAAARTAQPVEAAPVLLGCSHCPANLVRKTSSLTSTLSSLLSMVL